MLLFFWFVPVKKTVFYNCGINWEAHLETGWDCGWRTKFTLKNLLFGDSGTIDLK